jgi:formylglycine-generating enzyme required for sulfatase activity
MTPKAARARQKRLGQTEKSLDLGGGVTMRLVRIPAGEFAMGDAAGELDERPLARVAVARPMWLGACEVTNEQYRAFDRSHDCAYYQKRHARSDDKGLPLDGPDQPAVRVSWQQAMAFCRWLSRKTGMACTLPTEAQWEWACRAGSAAPLSFGPAEADFTPWANLADLSFRSGPFPLGKQVTGGVRHLVLEGATLSSLKFDDRAIVTAPVGKRKPNAWGLHDMHGNAAEWTRTTYRPYPYRDDDGRNAPAGPGPGRKVVRGGSFFDPPRRARSAFRLAYPAWQRVFNVGFRVAVVSTDTAEH